MSDKIQYYGGDISWVIFHPGKGGHVWFTRDAVKMVRPRDFINNKLHHKKNIKYFNETSTE